MDRKLIAVAVASALGLPMAAHAVEGSVSGHVNRAIVMVDQEGNPKDGDAQHVDANSSQSRIRFTGSEDLGNGLTVGLHMSYGASGAGFKDKNAPQDAADIGANDFTDFSFNRRHSNVYLSGDFGKVTIGQGSTTADGMAHADLGGASFLGGATNWCSYASMGPACPSNDGGRKEVLRYDTPAIGGVATLSGSTGNDDYWDVKLTVAGSMMDGGYDVRVGYIDESETITGSASFKLAQGTSVTGAWSQVDKTGKLDKTGALMTDHQEHEYQYVKVDHNYGDGSVGVYYKLGEYGNGEEGQLWGVGAGHSLGGGTTVYAGYRRIEADGAEDLNLFVAGMRVTFN